MTNEANSCLLTSSELHVSAATVLPIECLYLNKNAFISVVGHQPQHVKHFTLKRKPKAAAVRVDLLNKGRMVGPPMILGYPEFQSTKYVVLNENVLFNPE